MTNYGKTTLTLFAGMLVTGTLGSVHAFSVLIVALEDTFNAGRSDVSLIYSTALASLTALVLFGHRLYAATAPPQLAALACVCAAVGLGVAAYASSLWGLCRACGAVVSWSAVRRELVLFRCPDRGRTSRRCFRCLCRFVTAIARRTAVAIFCGSPLVSQEPRSCCPD